MRLNDGMPVWHVSASLWDPRGARVRSPGVVERGAIRLLAEVAGDREWWLWTTSTLVGHLRVALTAEENGLLPAWCADIVYDAGPSGPQRPRTRQKPTRQP